MIKLIRKDSFEPVYTDIHIHTYKNPDKRKSENMYNYQILIDKINSISLNTKKLISFTDHNTINKDAYLYNYPSLYYLILGAELHISYDKKVKPYHCHIFFNVDINDKISII